MQEQMAQLSIQTDDNTEPCPRYQPAWDQFQDFIADKRREMSEANRGKSRSNQRSRRPRGNSGDRPRGFQWPAARWK